MKTPILIGLFIGLTIYSTQGQDFRSSKEDFQKMAGYLSAGSGKWMAPNPNHDSSNPSSSQALGLWFEFRLKKNLLNLSIIAYRGDTAHFTSRALWVWHPGEQRIKYYDINLRQRLMEGETYFNSENEFVTRSITYQMDGTIFFARGENIILTDDEHFTRSMIYENGEWREQGRFTWKRTSENEGYQVIKYH